VAWQAGCCREDAEDQNSDTRHEAPLIAWITIHVISYQLLAISY